MAPLISLDFMAPRKLELGQIKIGGKGAKTRSAGGNEFAQPVKFDHFIVTTMERDKATDNYVKDQRIHEIIGEKPVELDAFLMEPEVEDNFLSEMARWEGRTKKVWVCDGKQATNLTTGQVCACECAVMQRGVKKQCKPYMRLHLQLLASGTSLGYHVFRSTSYRTTAQIQTTLLDIKRRFGTLYGAPVRLHCFFTQDTYNDGTKVRTGKSLKVGLSLRVPVLEAFSIMREHREALEAARPVEFKGVLTPIAESARETVAHLNQRDKEEEKNIAEEFTSGTEAEDISASVATQATLEGVVDKLITEADWEFEEPTNASREECETAFNDALTEAKLGYASIIKAWAEADNTVPSNYPDEWTADHFLYATEVVKKDNGVHFLVPYLLQKMEGLPEPILTPMHQRVEKETYTRAMCDQDIKDVAAYKRAYKREYMK